MDMSMKEQPKGRPKSQPELDAERRAAEAQEESQRYLEQNKREAAAKSKAQAESPDPIAPTALTEIGHCRNTFRVVVPAHVRPEHVERPEFWSRCGQALSRDGLDILEVVSAARTWISTLRVVSANPRAVPPIIVQRIRLEELPPPRAGADRTQPPLGHSVHEDLTRADSERWAVIRDADGARIASAPTRQLAVDASWQHPSVSQQ